MSPEEFAAREAERRAKNRHELFDALSRVRNRLHEDIKSQMDRALCTVIMNQCPPKNPLNRLEDYHRRLRSLDGYKATPLSLTGYCGGSPPEDPVPALADLETDLNRILAVFRAGLQP